jgi:RNA-directed DNA polymerase
MLAALEEGVQGGVWFSLIDKVTSLRGLQAAWAQVRSNRGSGGVDRETVDQFQRAAESRLSKLSGQLKDGRYQPLAVRRVYIPKPDGRERPLGIPAVRDRIVQSALRHVLEPVFEREFCEHSYGFRPGRGAKDALRRVDGQLKAGYRYVLDADLKSYFDTIPHPRLMSLIRQRVADSRVLALVEAFLNQSVLDEMREWRPTEGTPQGGVISPLLANIYLHPLDVLMRDQGIEMTRYADDFVILCRTADECSRALEMIRAWVTEAGLTLHPEKTRIVDMNEPGGFDFLGYHFERDYRKPSSRSMKKLKETIRMKTRRANGHSLSAIINNLNRTLRGWYGYFQHSRYWVFRDLDGWIRMRLRSILRKRQGKRGRGRGSDHGRWPNAYFAEMGLFSMLAAHDAASQPQGVH